MTPAVELPGEPLALQLQGITKRYGNLLALDDASLAVRRGSVHAVLGANGAGKSTLMRVAFGMTIPDAGTVRRDGRVVRLRSAADAIAHGVGMVHQHFTLIPAMTVAENLAVGGRGAFSPASAAERVRATCARTGMTLHPRERVETLSVPAQQRLEIAKALARDASLLVMDEPTAVLAPAEADELLAWLRRFADDGNAVILVTHKLREALAVADEVTVLRGGRVVLTAPQGNVSIDSLSAAMLGDSALPVSVGHIEPAPGKPGVSRPVVAIEEATVVDERGVTRLRGASLSIAAGEIVGVAGVEGAGHRELLRLIAGRLLATSGSVMLPDRIGFVPEDRHRDAVLLDRPLAETVALRGAGSRRGRMPWANIHARLAQLVDAFDVRGVRPGLAVRALSGGNQQKLVLARELGDVELVIAENPTRGLDVQATAEVLERLRECAASGTAVVVYSSDLDEVLPLATRMLVLHAGTVREAPVDRDRVGRMMLGAG